MSKLDSTGTDLALPASVGAGEGAPSWQVIVLGGLHAGAQVDLARHDVTLIGSAQDCDIVLRDPGVRAHHFMVFPQGHHLQLRAIEGDLVCAGQTLSAGSSVAIDNAKQWHCAAVALGAGVQGTPQWDALRSGVPAALDADAALTFNDEAGPSAAAAESAPPLRDHAPPAPAAQAGGMARARSPRWLRTRWQAVAVAVVVSATVGTGMVTWSFAGHKVRTRAAASAIAQTLIALKLPELRVVGTESGPLRVEGTLQSEADRGRLMHALGERGVYPAVDVVTGEQLADMVQNAFRQRGLKVQTAYAGGGRVDVRGAAASAVTEQIVGDVLAVKNAVTQIALLDAADAASQMQPPPAAAGTASATPAPAAVRVDAAAAARDPKRVVGVVGGRDPHVLTQDGRRYFVGSMLPDGTQVDRIEGLQVIFSRHGKSMPVQF
jgi:type III secretion protein D